MMGMQDRAERLKTDERLLTALAGDSEILEVDPNGSPPDRYRLKLKGQGVSRVSALKGDIQWCDEHEIELRMPFLYPSVPPDIRWVTSLFHPNLSYSGFLSLEDVGLPWDERVGLDVVCERLWDVARLAFVNLEAAVNPTAKRWLEDSASSAGIQLPVDPRPLRKIELPGARSNVVRYTRRGNDTQLNGVDESPAVPDVLFIGEDTMPPPLSPAPLTRELPEETVGRRARRPSPKGRSETDGTESSDGQGGADDDLFYIGDE